MVADDETVVLVDDVSKRFVIHVDKSIKERILNVRRRREARTDFWALKEVSVRIGIGETVGLIGHNGSGKSTLLKLIGGIMAPTDGTVARRGRIAALLELGAGFHPDLSGRENVYLNAAILGMSTAETDRVFDSIVDFSGIGEFIDTQVKFYSSGMYVRLAFAVAVHSDPDVLLVDEVLAVGDEPFQNKCMTKIRQFQGEGRTIVLVSHSAEQVADVCTRAVVLEQGRVIHDGDVGQGIRVLRNAYAEEQETEIAAESGRTPSVHIVSASLRDGRGGSLDGVVVRRGDPVRIEVVADVRRTTSWICGFTLATPLGQSIYRLNTEGTGLDLPREPGRYRVGFLIENSNFGSKRLVLSAGATDGDGRPLSLLDPAGHLDYADDEHGAGLIQFDVATDVMPVPA